MLSDIGQYTLLIKYQHINYTVMKNSTSYKTWFIPAFLFVVGSQLLPGCYDFDLGFSDMDPVDYTPEDNNRQLSGRVFNSVDSSGIEGIRFISWRSASSFCFSDCGIISCSERLTNTLGNFKFYKPECPYLMLDGNYRDAYQGQFTSNIDYDGNEAVFRHTDTVYLEIGLFPRTYINFHLKNVGISAETDSILISYENLRIEFDEYKMENVPSYGFMVNGPQTDYVVRGETRVGSVLDLKYIVVNEEGTKEYNQTIECKPLKRTDIVIEY